MASCLENSDCPIHSSCSASLLCACNEGFDSNFDFSGEESCISEDGLRYTLIAVAFFCSVYITLFLGFFKRLNHSFLQLVPLVLVILLFIGTILKLGGKEDLFIGEDTKITSLLGSAFLLTSISPQIYAYIQLHEHYSASNLPEQTKVRTMYMAKRGFLSSLPSFLAYVLLLSKASKDGSSDALIKGALALMFIDQIICAMVNQGISNRMEWDVKLTGNSEPLITNLLAVRKIRLVIAPLVMAILFLSGAVAEKVLEIWIYIYMILTLKAVIHSIVDLTENIYLEKLKDPSFKQQVNREDLQNEEDLKKDESEDDSGDEEDNDNLQLE